MLGYKDRRRSRDDVPGLGPPTIAWGTAFSRPSPAARDSWAKSTYDIIGASVVLLLVSTLMVLVAVAIKLESRGPVFYRSRRVGLRGRHFDMLKFRKMHRDAGGPPLTAHDDDRLTRVGALLRRTRLDELPQLWNVLRGDMSLVGPRPEDPTFVALYPEEYAEVLSVKPGITGLSQLAFAKESDILERPELAGRYADRVLPAKIAIDRLYVARRSTPLDTRILAWTARAMLTGRDIAIDRRSARISILRRVEEQARILEEQARILEEQPT